MTINVRKAYQSKNVIGMRVRNSSKDDLGSLEEIVVDIDSGKIAYAVLSFNGFFGFVEKFFAIPWSEFTLKHDEDESYFILDTDRDKLAVLPGFDKKDWPDMANSNWDTELDQHYQSGEQAS